jgi:uncharacterized protein YjbI with pentapeptide repeats
MAADYVNGLPAAVAAVGAAASVAWTSIQTVRLASESARHSQSHDLQLFREMASEDERLSTAAAAILIERLRAYTRFGVKNADARALIAALLGALRATAKSRDRIEATNKIIFEGVVECLGAVSGRDTKKSATAAKSSKYPLKKLDFQNIVARNVHVSGLFVKEVDFYGADFQSSGLRFSDFRNAILYRANISECRLNDSSFVEANLFQCNLSKSDLRGCDFTSARVDGAQFTGARVDQTTLLPFDRSEALGRGMVWVD